MINSVNKNTLITSDTHLGHKNILRYCKDRKNFLKNKSHEEVILEKVWENNKGRTILVLGDFNFKGSSKYKEVISQTDSILIPGNHDKYKASHYINSGGFKEVIEGVKVVTSTETKHIKDLPFLANALILDIEGKRVLFSHFPLFHDCHIDKTKDFYKAIQALEELYILYSCDLNVHGHTHAKDSTFRNSFNASIDKHPNLEPFLLEDILRKN